VRFSADSIDTKIVIPATAWGTSVTKIATGAFMTRDKVTEVTIPEGVTSIGDLAFRDCIDLTIITIPKSVTSIGKEMFTKVTSGDLTNLEVTIYGYSGSYAETYAKENSIPFIPLDSEDTVYFSTAPLTGGSVQITEYYGNAANVEVPKMIDGKPVAAIGENAFKDNVNMVSITIPSSIHTIDISAFANSDIKIIGYEGTQAEVFAGENGYAFSSDSDTLIKNDLNGDGIVSNKDLTYYNRALAEWDGYAVAVDEGDVNDDRVIDNKDSSYYARALADWPGYLIENKASNAPVSGTGESLPESLYSSVNISDIWHEDFTHADVIWYNKT
jgi:hypothetical protein